MTAPETPAERHRFVLGHVPTSVAVVAGVVDGEPTGLSIGSLVSVSLEPPLIGFLVARTSTSWPVISEAGSFCVSVLSAAQANVSRQFAVSRSDKFAGFEWHAAPSGHPIMDGAVAWIDCVARSEVEVGDHLFVVGEVGQLEVLTEEAPLLHYRGGYRRPEEADLCIA